MAWETIEKGAEELTGMYPKFDEIGQYVEGNFMGLEVDDYNNQRILIYKGTDAEDELITQLLPAAADLKRYYSKLNKGDYVRIEFVKAIPSNNENYSDKKIFKVQVDHSRDVEFGDEDDE